MEPIVAMIIVMISFGFSFAFLGNMMAHIPGEDKFEAEFLLDWAVHHPRINISQMKRLKPDSKIRIKHIQKPTELSNGLMILTVIAESESGVKLAERNELLPAEWISEQSER